jgi:1,4-alpha-glucan branching enzyme
MTQTTRTEARPREETPKTQTAKKEMRIERIKMQTASSQNKNFTDSPTQFAFQAPTTRQVSLAGCFNNWDTRAAPMQKGNDGIWRLSLPLEPGRYEYRFYADGVWQDDPTAQQRAANALGSQNCVRNVAA